MKIDPEDTPIAGERKCADAVEQAGTSVLPGIDLTFSEAERQIESASPDDAAELAMLIHATAPKTHGDAIVKLRLLTSDLGIAGSESETFTNSVEQILGFMISSQAHPAIISETLAAQRSRASRFSST
ncbi:hypothetical protein [Azospirillum doebereinerae]|uniref:Uncharacterized protein n=1 Tax=Azospirillum doebereinerae TaxID=92933 RepID=A0A3S0X6F8_9PROT|nr:hypothetical protein [Azospirillum doebereinerae]RUQ59749.1 hypothetical protein EJ913_31005 [Azospirillum doebereinerae]